LNQSVIYIQPFPTALIKIFFFAPLQLSSNKKLLLGYKKY